MSSPCLVFGAFKAVAGLYVPAMGFFSLSEVLGFPQDFCAWFRGFHAIGLVSGLPAISLLCCGLQVFPQVVLVWFVHGSTQTCTPLASQSLCNCLEGSILVRTGYCMVYST